MPRDDFVHTVGPGDCIVSIADTNGHFWKSLWNAPENASLKADRKDPNVLQLGDDVFVPALRLKWESRATEATHRFKKKGVPAKLRMCLMVCGHPRAFLRYVATIDGTQYEGSTDRDGHLEIDIPPQAQSGRLALYAKNGVEEYELNLGHLDPITTITGVQQRLRNMGVPCEVSGVLDESTKFALLTFQGRESLEPDGVLNQALRDAIKSAHGA